MNPTYVPCHQVVVFRHCFLITVTQYKNRKPGNVSQNLQEALGMIPGHPPPWLINMQRYGPPPSYPDLKIPGLNSPIPPGGQFGYHPGGWGKPPVDEHGNPLYGNVFGAWEENEETDDEVWCAVTTWWCMCLP